MTKDKEPSSANGCLGECKEELELENLGLEYDQPENFAIAQWRWRRLYYVCYRTTWAAFFIIWFIVSSLFLPPWSLKQNGRPLWYVYFNNWIFVVQALHAFSRAVTSIRYFYMKARLREDIPVYPYMPVGLKICWILYNISTDGNFFVIGMCWVFPHTPDPEESIDIHTAIICIVFVLLDVFIPAMPVRLLHAVHFMGFLVIFFIFSIIYQFAGGQSIRGEPYIYHSLDWKNTAKSCLIAALAIFVFAPLVHTLVYLLYRLKVYIYSRLHKGKPNDLPEMTPGDKAKQYVENFTDVGAKDNESVDTNTTDLSKSSQKSYDHFTTTYGSSEPVVQPAAVTD